MCAWVDKEGWQIVLCVKYLQTIYKVSILKALEKRWFGQQERNLPSCYELLKSVSWISLAILSSEKEINRYILSFFHINF